MSISVGCPNRPEPRHGIALSLDNDMVVDMTPGTAGTGLKWMKIAPYHRRLTIAQRATSQPNGQTFAGEVDL